MTPRPNIRLSSIPTMPSEEPLPVLDWLTTLTWLIGIVVSVTFWGLVLLWAVWGSQP